MPLLRCFIVSLAGVTFCSYSTASLGDSLSQAVETDLSTINASINSQKTIDHLSNATRKMLDEYRMATRHADTLKTYNKYLQEQLAAQTEEKNSLLKQLQEIEVTQSEIIPLMLRMLDGLEKFIKLDIPFLPQEREERISKLREMMNSADISESEKFRRILEAYQVENEYGKTIEAYRGEITLNGSLNSVDFLRLGRLALYYQKLDGSESGHWNLQTNQWETLPSDYRQAIRNGLRIARKETAPDLLTLPLNAPETDQ